MRRRIGKRWFSVYAFDVESHADDESAELKETGVWLYSFINEAMPIDDESCFGYSIEEFLDRIEAKSKSKKRNHHGKENEPNNLMIYVWNLSFEWSFVLPALLRRGFRWSIDGTGEKTYSTVSTKTCSSVWEIKMRFGKSDGIIIFRDLMKIFPGSLRKVAKSFDLPTQKGDIDYRVNRRHGWVVTKEEKEYCWKDTRIVIDILVKMAERNDREFWNVMSAASYTAKKALIYSYPWTVRPLKEYRKKYPELGAEETEFMRHSVAGGLTYCPDRWQFKDVKGPIGHIDFHQSHPSRMASMHGERFPYGFGTYGQGKPQEKYRYMACCHVLISFTTAKLHSIISMIGFEYIEDAELWLWDFEIDTAKRCYNDFEVKYIDYYEYKWSYLPWKNYCLDNYNKRLEAKRNGDAFGVMYYKLLNNSLYGKTLENGHPIQFENIVNNEGQMDSIEHANEKAGIGGKYTYVPVGSAIPAYSRCALIRAAMKLGYENVLYMDTDSIFFLWNAETKKKIKLLEINEKMGSFGWEDVDANGKTTLDGAMFTAPKRYKLHSKDGSFDVKMAGVSAPKEDLNGDELDYDHVNMIDGFFMAKTKVRVEGGTLILPKVKHLKVQAKYMDTLQKNTNQR